VSKEIVDLVVRIARESPTWGYDRIQGALANLGFNISATTVATILKAHGVDPAPDRRRRSNWKTFLEAHWDVLASVDFTTVEVWTKSGLITCYLLFFMQSAGQQKAQGYWQRAMFTLPDSPRILTKDGCSKLPGI
jgi:hypothetical protein